MSLFITFEGPDGSGKTTQIRLLTAALQARGKSVIATREPGGTHIGNMIRSLLLDPTHGAMSPRAEALLFNAARAQLVDEIIQPALAQGTIVLCDRYGDSTLAYQGYGRGQPVNTLRDLVEYATGGLQPHLTIYLDVDAAVGLQRKQDHERNRMEGEQLAFHQAVRTGYHTIAQQDTRRWLVISGALPMEEIHTRILARLLPMLDRV